MGAKDEKQRVALEVCRTMGMDRHDAQVVAEMAETSEASWPLCCESGCTPCVEDLAAAARQVRARLAADRTD